MTESSAGPGDATTPDPFAPPVVPPVASPVVPPPAPPAAAGDPNRHFDGQQWLVWNGTAWVPEPPPVPPSSGGRRTLVVVVAIIVVGLLAGATVVGLRAANANKDVVIPSSLGGLPKATEADIIAAANQFRENGSSSIRDAKSDAAAYGSSDGDVAFLIVARAGISSDDFFSGAKSSGVDISAVTAVGDAECVTAQAQGVSVCMRSSGSLLVAVVLGPSDPTKTAGMVDEAWALQ